jgi:hypothetical protein
MKIFLSWSGARSLAVAKLLRDWLPLVIQNARPWLSAEDIERGARWSTSLARELVDTQFGILCVTAENRRAPWLLFEAGALSKSLERSLVCPLLLDVHPADLDGPLVQFQGATACKEDAWKLIQTLNGAMGESRLIDLQLERTFSRWWPDLANALARLPPANDGMSQPRPQSELVNEILELVRKQNRLLSGFELNWFSTKKLRQLESILETLHPLADSLEQYFKHRRGPTRRLRSPQHRVLAESPSE